MSCERRRPCCDKFPNISCVFVFSHVFFNFEPFILSIVIHFPHILTTHVAQHNTHTAHNTHNTQAHTAHNTHITSHHITFCTCLALILVVMASVSGQAVVVGGGLAGTSQKGGAKKPELTKLCENSGADVEWLLDKFNVNVSLVARLGYHHRRSTGCVCDNGGASLKEFRYQRASRSLYLDFVAKDKQNHPVADSLQRFSQVYWSSTSLSGQTIHLRNRECVVLDLFSNFK